MEKITSLHSEQEACLKEAFIATGVQRILNISLRSPGWGDNERQAAAWAAEKWGIFNASKRGIIRTGLVNSTLLGRGEDPVEILKELAVFGAPAKAD